MTQAVFAIPGDLATPTGGYAYDREVLARLPRHGVSARHLALPGSFPWASVNDLAVTQHELQGTDPGDVLLIDGLAYGAMTDLVLRSVERRIVALVHHPLAYETGLPERRRRALHASERDALARAEAVVVTSPSTADLLVADYAVPAERISVALPGTERRARATGSPDVPHLLSVGAVSERKAYDVLIDALAAMVDRPWRAMVVGDLTRAPDVTDRLMAAREAAGLGDRLAFVGAVDEATLAAHFAQADLFVHPARFEGYGMALAEALACGLPIVCTSGGAAARTAPDDAALKVAPGDAMALASAIASLLDDPDARRRRADAAWAASRALPGWDDTAGVIAGVLHAVGRR